LELFRASRGRVIAKLDMLDDAGWSRNGVHQTYGRLDVAGLMRRTIAHDEEHIASFG
jgi:phytoene/squalene synthetase